MAGETQKSVALTAIQSGASKKREARLSKGREVTVGDKHQFLAATELEAADRIIFHIDVPSNAIYGEIAVYNDDLDTGSGVLTVDFGLSAAKDFTSVTSGTATRHLEDALLDADLFVDNAADLAVATTNYTVLAPDPTTLGPDDALKPMWELLAYDEDPQTDFRLSMVVATAANALASAGDLVVRMKYIVD